MMFFLKKAIAAFILPAGVFVALLAAGGIYFWRRNRRPAVFCFVIAGLMWLTSTRLFSEALLRPLESAFPVPAEPAGQVIVVLSGGAYEDRPVISACELLPPTGLERVTAAAPLQRRTGLPVLVTGGTPYSKRSEADVMAACLAELGVPAAKVIKEETSRDTQESAVASRQICAAKGCDRIILLTSASHIPRAVHAFGKAGFPVIVPYPVARVSAERASWAWWNLLPADFYGARRALNEYAGLVFYKLAY